jgi:hypothetical protein
MLIKFTAVLEEQELDHLNRTKLVKLVFRMPADASEGEITSQYKAFLSALGYPQLDRYFPKGEDQ